MSGGGDEAVETLGHTPSWAVATVCFLIISVSLLLEHSIHLLMNWLKRRHNAVLYDAIGRLKSELMLLGFLSLLLSATERYIASICVPATVANRMLPCGREMSLKANEHWTSGRNYELFQSFNHSNRKLLSKETSYVDPCASKNAFEMAFFIWVTIQFGTDSCYHERVTNIVRIVLAVAVQFMCSYITLPIYALVTQMGTHFKGEIFNEKVVQVLKQWHSDARRRRRKIEFTPEKSPPARFSVEISYES